MSHTTFSQKDWENYARCYDGLNALRPYRTLLSDVIGRLHAKTDERILEAACGTGNLTKLLCDALIKNTIHAVDYSVEMLARAKEKCGTRAHFLQADLNEQLPYERGYFNAIVSINTLYALAKPKIVLEEFKRLLAPGGRLILVTPKEGYQNGLILKAHCGSKKPDHYWENMHTTSEREIARINEACGNSAAADALRTIAACNRAINKNHAFHFFTAAVLQKIVEEAGFSVHYHGEAYAKQCHLMILKRSDLFNRERCIK
jgi:ubiquinone/menaquinone biosynthesis C-methylase UbiE